MVIHLPSCAGARAVGKPVSANRHCWAPRHRSSGPNPMPSGSCADPAGSSPGQLRDRGAGGRAARSAHRRRRRSSSSREGAPAAGCSGRAPHPGPHEWRRARPHLHRPGEEDARVRRQLLHVEVHGAPVRRAAAPAPAQPAAPRPASPPGPHPAHLLPAPALCARAEADQSSPGRGQAGRGGARWGGALLGALLPPAGRRPPQPAPRSNGHFNKADAHFTYIQFIILVVFCANFCFLNIWGFICLKQGLSRPRLA